jgi:predicted glycosyltransferase
MADRPIIVMYSPDTIGLGHIKRHTAISMEVLRQVPDANIILLVGSGIGAFFELPKGVDSIKIPSVQKVGSAEWRPRTLSLPGAATARLRARLIRETIDTLRPDVLLVDHLPTGVWNELTPALELIRYMRFPTRVILGLRDILDDAVRIRRRWSAEGYYDVIRNYYDQLFIYGVAEVFPTAEMYHLERHFAGEISYCGYVCADADKGASATPPQDMRAELFGSAEQAAHKHLIVVTAGGGHDAYPMMSAVLAAMKQLKSEGTVWAVMITGPLMPEEQRAQLREQASGLPVTLLSWTMQLQSYLDAADIVITMGGYNSLLETARLGKRAINIPRPGPSKEQTMRATLFDQLGLVTHVPLDNASPDRVANSIRTTLRQPLEPHSKLRLDGAQQAAQFIRRALHGRDGRRAPLRSNWTQSPYVVY